MSQRSLLFEVEFQNNDLLVVRNAALLADVSSDFILATFASATETRLLAF